MPKTLKQGLRLLKALMTGRELAAREDELRSVGVDLSSAHAGRYLKTMAEELPEVEPLGVRPQRWRFVWPVANRADPALVLALSIARELMGGLRGSWMELQLRDLLQEHLQRLGPDDRAIDTSREIIRFSRLMFQRPMGGDHADTISQAIRQRREIQFHYVRQSGARLYRVEPYSILLYEDAVYLVGKCIETESVRHVLNLRVWNLSAMKRCRLLDKVFTYPTLDEYNPVKLFGHCFGPFLPRDGVEEPEEVILQLASPFAVWLNQNRLHHTQRLETIDDQWIQATITVFITFDLVHWIRGHGLEVKVVSPPRLKDWVISGEGPAHKPRPKATATSCAS